MKAEDFNPSSPELDINGKTATFGLFSLYHKTWAHGAFASKEQPNGLANLVEGLRSLDKVVIAKFAWRLLDNKREIKEEAFFKFAERNENVMQILEVLNRVLELSQPGTKANERMKELKKS